MSRLFILAVCLASLAWAAPPPAISQASVIGTEGGYVVNVYFFWAQGCSYCQKARAFLDELAMEFPHAPIQSYEVYMNSGNREVYKAFLEKLGRRAQGLPTMIVGDTVWSGFQPEYADEIRTAVSACLRDGCPDAGVGIVPPIAEKADDGAVGQQSSTGSHGQAPLETSFLERFPIAQNSLVASTLLIGFLDGFNPCSLWVLGVLLSLAVLTKSRARTFLIGGLFILISTAIYGLFISGIFSLFSILNSLKFIRAAFMLVALFFGVVNIKDYFFFKQGLSLTIADQEKAGLYQKMRRLVMSETSLAEILIGVTLLAAGVSLVELSCTSGFPILWSNLLTSQDVSLISYLGLLGLYLFIYAIDEIFIFLFVVISLRSVKLNQAQGRFLKLASGVVISALGVVMLFRPEWMNQPLPAALVFLGSISCALIIHIITRRVAHNQS